MSMRRPEVVQPVDEKKLQAVIEKGGAVASSKKGLEEETTKNVQLRLTPQVIARIDQVRGERLVAPPRHAWLLEAILEKLDREGQ